MKELKSTRKDCKIKFRDQTNSRSQMFEMTDGAYHVQMSFTQSMLDQHPAFCVEQLEAKFDRFVNNMKALNRLPKE